MKKIISAVLLLTLSAMCFAEKKVYVKTKNADLMKKKSALAGSATVVSYGAELIVMEESDGWYYVQLSGKKNVKGWIKESKTTDRKLSTRSSANAKEIALAGKGFNAEIENLYANSGNGNYDAVDEVEKTEVKSDKINTFIEKGMLNGGAK